MTIILSALEVETHHELPFSPVVFGLIAFAILMTLLIITLAIGKGRLHS